MPKAQASIKIEFRTLKKTRAIVDALSPEISHQRGKKARATVIRRRNQLNIKLVAKDSATLRAIITSYMRLIRATHNVLAETEHSLSKHDNG